jgi:hypothetical protein
MLRKKRQNKKPTKIFQQNDGLEEKSESNRFVGIYDEDLLEETKNKNKNEGENMTSEKIDSKQQFEIDDSSSYDLMSFKLEDKHFLALESENEIQAVKVSKEFYDAFKKEFNK